jgi:hypothetical protein
VRADERTRTADLLITSELLYLLSYVGLFRAQSISQRAAAFMRFRLTRKNRPRVACYPRCLGVHERRKDLVEGYGYPQLTERAERKILGENLLRLSGMDVEEARRKLNGAG